MRAATPPRRDVPEARYPVVWTIALSAALLGLVALPRREASKLSPSKRDGFNPAWRVRAGTPLGVSAVYIAITQEKTDGTAAPYCVKEQETPMNTRIAAAVAAVILGVAASVASATAYPYAARNEVQTTGSLGVHDSPFYESHPGYCAPSSAAEGNANQQTRPVKQYGQTTGGNRC